MDSRIMQFLILYALAAKDGREQTLFGTSQSAAIEAFTHSLAGASFPEVWFELPLLGEPWLDFHALVTVDDLPSNTKFSPEVTGGHPEVFEWFANTDQRVRQLALSWDTSTGTEADPAVQLLVSTSDPTVTCDFLHAAGRPDAIPSYQAFRERIPKSWFPCYAGVFPQRPGHHLRVECIPDRERQEAYAHDASILEADLIQAGFRDLGSPVAERCHMLAGTPFQFELQFDILSDGSTGSTLGASVRFGFPGDDDGPLVFDVEGAAGKLMHQVETWDLADERWKLLGNTTFVKQIKRKGDNTDAPFFCYPAFLKLRWRDGEPLGAKAYLMAGQFIQPTRQTPDEDA